MSLEVKNISPTSETLIGDPDEKSFSHRVLIGIIGIYFVLYYLSHWLGVSGIRHNIRFDKLINAILFLWARSRIHEAFLS